MQTQQRGWRIVRGHGGGGRGRGAEGRRKDVPGPLEAAGGGLGDRRGEPGSLVRQGAQLVKPRPGI